MAKVTEKVMIPPQEIEVDIAVMAIFLMTARLLADVDRHCLKEILTMFKIKNNL